MRSLLCQPCLPCLFALISLGVAIPLSAQESPFLLGWTFFPSIELGAVYDDNILLRPGESAGTTYGRARATFDLARRGTSNTLRGGYSATAELFPKEFDELTKVPARQRASIGFQSRAGERGSLDLAASYLQSRSPNEVIDDTGLELGRRRSEGYNGVASFTRRVTETSSLALRYSFGARALGTDLTSELASKNTSHSFGMGWQRRHSSITEDSILYMFRLFVDDQLAQDFGLGNHLQTHVLAYRWDRQLNSRSSLGFTLGPRFSQTPASSMESARIEWNLSAEAALTYSYRWSRADLSLSYARTQLQSFGLTGRVDTDRVIVRLGLDPSPLLQITLSPAAYRNTRPDDSPTETYRFTARLVSPVTNWLSLRAEYSYSYQTGSAQPIGQILDPGDRSRNLATMGITLGKSIPLE